MKPIHLLPCLLVLAGLTLAPPGWGAKPEAAKPASGAASEAVKAKPASVDINTNTDPAKLRALDPELTEARAQTIIARRPYDNIDELIGQKILPQKLFDRIKGYLTASRVAKPPPPREPVAPSSRPS